MNSNCVALPALHFFLPTWKERVTTVKYRRENVEQKRGEQYGR